MRKQNSIIPLPTTKKSGKYKKFKDENFSDPISRHPDLVS